ncbi:N-acetyltransferase [Enterobacteriaceae bacterium 155047]|uniref:N-acetyltransferase n=1 Tax=Huaxiibacter chinensis TaxID=2899785 RepID=UPI0007DAAB08|nr:N-acetyltransferase [Huaxiibacter chinensis]ANG91061.1 N-acetyltransferase [Lelliottia amnigena]MCG5045311.1 N-acetyltransferase [Huaxiibacter chinensis]
MIHKWQSNDTAPLLRLWMESTTEAHPFIDAQYWKESEPLVRNTWLPSAETWVWMDAGELRGFISVMHSQFIGALFVDPAYLGKGIGKALIAHVKQRYADLTLEVYQKNSRAVNFYHAQGFRIEDSAWQDETQHPTWIMRWQEDQTP